MGTTKIKTIFYSEKKLLNMVDKFWHKFGFSSRSKTIAWLVAYALSQNPTPPPQNDDY